jgi:hypothetical protein
MRLHSAFVVLCSVCVAGVAACAGGDSSVTRSAGAVPAAVQQGAAVDALGSASRSLHSGTRRTLSVPTCSGNGVHAFVGGGTGNVAGGTDSLVGAGENNQACDDISAIVNGNGNAISGTGGFNYYSFIGGGQSNVITGEEGSSSIVGGDSNAVTAPDSAIVGGQNNSISTNGSNAAITSGYQNTLSGEYGFIGAGLHNTVSGEGGYVAAGGYNTVSGTGAVIDGGFNSAAAGNFATIPGGYVNSAAGTYSFAAGARASAAQTGTFVWSDGSDGDAILSSTAAYQFLARASGGFTLWTNAGSTVGARLGPGSGTWASASDRNLKTDVARIDDAAVLDKVASLPIERWSYKSERGVRHVGPMAQDFYAAFGVGEDDKHITSIDEDGVALAAIKALHAENARLRAQLARYRATTDARLARLTAAVAALKAR